MCYQLSTKESVGKANILLNSTILTSLTPAISPNLSFPLKDKYKMETKRSVDFPVSAPLGAVYL